MGDTNGNYRLEIILLRRAVELILENGRKHSDETSPKGSVDCDFPQSIEYFAAMALAHRRLSLQRRPPAGKGSTKPLRQRRTRLLLPPLMRAGVLVIRRATRRCHRLWCAGVSRRRFALANSRPKWQSQSRNRVIGWTPV